MARIIDIYPDAQKVLDFQDLVLIDEMNKIKRKSASTLKNIYFYLCFIFFSFCYDFKPVIV